jgi:GNAT superfamily N-acetyltransferase
MTVSAPPRWEALYAEAHAERFRFLAGSGRAEFRREPGVLAVATGAWSNTDNGIVLERDDVDEELIGDLVGWFRDPASLICSGFDASDELRERLTGLGLEEETTGVSTGVDLRGLELPSPSPPDGISIAEATTARDLDDWLEVALATGIYEQRDRRPLPLRHWVARRRNRPVGLATAFFLSGTVLLEHVAVIEEERRRGLGTALALVRLHEARRFGCGLAVFGTTPESAALYSRFGFTTQPDEGRRWFYLPLEP